MSVISALWLLMASASLTLGLVHLLVWLRQRHELAHLLFFCLALSAATFALFELALMQAASSETYATTLKWAQVPLCAFVLSTVGFVRSYFSTGRLWLAGTICSL